MSDPLPDNDSKKWPGRRLFHGRKLGPIVVPGIACAFVATLIYYFEHAMPAFHEVVKPVYFVIGTVFVIFTGRAIRSREGKRRGPDRRHADRRHTKRPD
jgi:hypothetical protein